MQNQPLSQVDPIISNLIKQEDERQLSSIRLIASENYASKAVMEATGSSLTNKYSEGYAGKRYYEGNEVVDEVEKIAIERAQKLFKTDYHVNVQPYSGSPANLTALLSLAKLGDTIMGMHLFHGGHLTHGWKYSFTSKLFNAAQYTVSEKTHELDYDELASFAQEHKPKVIICGYTAYPRKINFQKFREIADNVGAYLLADISHITGLVVSDLHASPVGLADVITTTSHKTLRGPRGAFILCKQKLAKKIDKAIIPGLQGGPHNHTTAAIAVALKEAGTPEFREYAAQIIKNAQRLAQELIDRNYKLITGGTDNHLILVDTAGSKNILGKDAATALSKAGIVANANSIPFDPNPPLKPSGIRIGTPSITTIGAKEDDMAKVANFMNKAIENSTNDKVLAGIKQEVKEFMKKFR